MSEEVPQTPKVVTTEVTVAEEAPEHSSEDSKADKTPAMMSKRAPTKKTPSAENVAEDTPSKKKKSRKPKGLTEEELLQKRKKEEEAEARKRLKAEAEEKKRFEAEERKRLKVEADEKKRQEMEEKKRKQAELEEKRRQEAEEKKRKQTELEEKRRQEAEERKRRQDEADEKKRQETEEKKRQQDEAEEKKRRQAEKFKNFFVKIDSPRAPQTLPAMQNARFQPFQIKEGMRLAPIQVRHPLSNAEYNALLCLSSADGNNDDGKCLNYLTELRSGCRRGNINRKEIVAVDENGVGLKVKLIQFFENIRPPYYGTWRKRSAKVTPRRPFAQDVTLNYEYDSDQDWEEEPSDAEECKSDDEEDAEKDEEDEDNDGFFVEHGYLSSDEGSENEEEASADEPAASADKGDVRPTAGVKAGQAAKNRWSVETDEQRKHRMAQRAEEWNESQKMKMKRYKKSTACSATVFGPSWSDSEEDIVLDDEQISVDESGDKRQSRLLPLSLRSARQMRAIIFTYDQLVPSLPPPEGDGKENLPTTPRTPKTAKSSSKNAMPVN